MPRVHWQPCGRVYAVALAAHRARLRPSGCLPAVAGMAISGEAIEWGERVASLADRDDVVNVS